MPLVAHMPLPTFDYLGKRGEQILSLDDALKQDIRELHIGFLNMMPDAALQATEHQFMRLVGSSNQIAQGSIVYRLFATGVVLAICNIWKGI